MIKADAQGYGLIAYYPFNNNAEDFSGYGNNGRINGGVTTVPDRFNNPCSAMLFDGMSGFIEVPNSASISSPVNAFSLCVWYKLSATTGNNYWLTLVCKGSDTSELIDNPQYRVQTQQNFSIQTTTCTPIPDMSSTISLSTKSTMCDNDVRNHLLETNKWHFYALTYDGSSMKAYMDGKIVFQEVTSYGLTKNNASLYIGKDEPGSLEYFNGALDDMQLYDMALSDNDVQKIYNDNLQNPYTEDFDMPSIQDITSYTSSTGCDAKVNFNAPVLNSVCFAPTVKQIEGLSPGSTFKQGTHRVKYKISSASDFTQYVSFYIHVKDAIPPVLKTPQDVTVYAKPGDSGLVHTYKDPTATDNCKVKSVKKINGHTSGDFFSIGDHKITYEAEDQSGNKVTQDFIVHVLKNKKTKDPDTNSVVKIQVVKKTDTVNIVKRDTISILKRDTISILKRDTVNLLKTDTLTIVKSDTVKLVQRDTVVVYKTDTVTINNQKEKEFTDTLSVKSYKPNNLLFLIDVSGSMNTDNQIKLKYAKICVQSLVKKLRNIDRFTILSFSDNSTVIYPTSQLTDRPALVSLIEKLEAKGETNGSDAISHAYDVLENNYLQGGNNEIYIFTDDQITDISKKQRKKIKSKAEDNNKITLNIIAFGNNNGYLDELQEIPKIGGGRFFSIQNEDDAKDKLLQLIKLNSSY